MSTHPQLSGMKVQRVYLSLNQLNCVGVSVEVLLE